MLQNSRQNCRRFHYSKKLLGRVQCSCGVRPVRHFPRQSYISSARQWRCVSKNLNLAHYNVYHRHIYLPIDLFSSAVCSIWFFHVLHVFEKRFRIRKSVLKYKFFVIVARFDESRVWDTRRNKEIWADANTWCVSLKEKNKVFSRTSVFTDTCLLLRDFYVFVSSENWRTKKWIEW